VKVRGNAIFYAAPGESGVSNEPVISSVKSAKGFLFGSFFPEIAKNFFAFSSSSDCACGFSFGVD